MSFDISLDDEIVSWPFRKMLLQPFVENSIIHGIKPRGRGFILVSASKLKEDWIVAAGPYTFDVPEGCYLMLGDNRNDSWDSRYWTNNYVEENQILGESLFTYWPFKNFGKLR